MTIIKPIGSNYLSRTLLVLFGVLLGACGSDSGDSIEGVPDNLIGYEMVQTVETGEVVAGDPMSVEILQPGGTLTYRFIDENTIEGAGLNVLPTVFWSYQASGNSGEVFLEWQHGDTVDQLTFNDESSGRFESEQRLFLSNGTSVTVAYTGSFEVFSIGGGGAGGDISGQWDLYVVGEEECVDFDMISGGITTVPIEPHYRVDIVQEGTDVTVAGPFGTFSGELQAGQLQVLGDPVSGANEFDSLVIHAEVDQSAGSLVGSFRHRRTINTFEHCTIDGDLTGQWLGGQ